MFMRSIFGLTAAALLSMSPAPAKAGSGVVGLEDIAQVEVLQGWRTKSGAHMSALRITLAPGWKTYWRAPGDAGIPPQFSWTGSDNLRAVQFHWPTPDVFYQNGVRSIGYKSRVVIPMEMTPVTIGGDIKVRGEIQFGVCEDICLPMTVDLTADLGVNGHHDPVIAASLKDQPINAKTAGVRNVACEIEPIADGLRVTATIGLPKRGSKDFAIMEFADQTVWVSEATAKRSGGTLTVTSDFVPPNAAPFIMNRSDIRITILGDNRAIDVQGCLAN